MTDITAKLPVSTKRLKQIAHAIADGDYGELSMRIPAEPDRDADLVISAAADEIDRLRAEVARLNDGNRKYAVALTKDQGAIDWRKWMLVPVTECEFIPKAKHDAEIARLRDALGKIAKGRTGLDPEESDAEWRAYWANLCIDYRSMARAALAQVAEVGK